MPSFWENLRFSGAKPSDQPGQSYDEDAGAESQDMFLYVSHPPPSAGTSWPSIIVAQEAFGVNRHIEKVCDRFAEAGYVAIAPALYHRDHPNPQLGSDEMPVRGMSHCANERRPIDHLGHLRHLFAKQHAR